VLLLVLQMRAWLEQATSAVVMYHPHLVHAGCLLDLHWQQQVLHQLLKLLDSKGDPATAASKHLHHRQLHKDGWHRPSGLRCGTLSNGSSPSTAGTCRFTLTASDVDHHADDAGSDRVVSCDSTYIVPASGLASSTVSSARSSCSAQQSSSSSSGSSPCRSRSSAAGGRCWPREMCSSSSNSGRCSLADSSATEAVDAAGHAAGATRAADILSGQGSSGNRGDYRAAAGGDAAADVSSSAWALQAAYHDQQQPRRPDTFTAWHSAKHPAVDGESDTKKQQDARKSRKMFALWF